MDSFRETLAYLDSFINYERRPAFGYKESLKLERVRDFLTSIGDPQDSFTSIHVAGTKGKGSVCAFTAFMLRQLGLRTGLYTSPHLSDVRERIRILAPGSRNLRDDFEGTITREELSALVKRLRPKIDAYCARCAFGALSFFEVYTTLAFSYFKAKKTDVAVLETGLGGRLDATNVVCPVICGITSISHDHMDKLGNTLKEIAGEKAGIIKGHRNAKAQGHKLIVVSAPQEDPVRDVLRKRCRSQDALLYEVNRDIIVEAPACDGRKEVFSLKTPWGDFRDVRINLRGAHQITNAAVAISLVAGYRAQRGLALDETSLCRGLGQTRWPARFEVFGSKPCVVIDGAHNPAAAGALRRALQQYYRDKGIVFVLGVSKDKDAPGIIKELTSLARRIIVTRADNPRAQDPGVIKKIIAGLAQDVPVTVSGSVAEALAGARRSADPADIIVVTGSIFVAGEARVIVRAAEGCNQNEKERI